MIRKIVLIISIFIIVFLCPIYAYASDFSLYIQGDTTSDLETVLKNVFPNSSISSVPEKELSFFIESPNNIAQIDEDKVDFDSDFFYKRLYRATVVIAIDRDMVNDDIKSFKDLLKTPYDVYIPKHYEYAVVSIGYGMGEGHLDLDRAYVFLRTLETQDRLHIYKYDNAIDKSFAPISIIYDYEAVKLKKSGRNIDIVLPEEGTLYFDVGLISKSEFHYDEKLMANELIKSGFRLSDGSSSDLYKNLDYSKAYSGSPFKDKIYYSHDISNSINRKVFGTRMLGPSSTNEAIALHLALICLSLTWGSYSYYRVLHKKIRLYLFIIAIACAFWSCMKILRLVSNISSSYSIRLWYFYYVSILIISTLSLWIALSVDKSLEPGKLKAFKIFSTILSAIFLLLVITNNRHHLVFTFPYFMNDKHDYNILFYPIFLWEIASLIATLVILSIKSFYRPNRKTMLVPFGAGAFMLTFMLLYHIGWSTKISTDITFTSVIAVIMCYELCMRTWLIPTNSEYRQIFQASTISMKILDKQKNTVYTSSSNLKGDNIERIEEPIIGGYAVRYEDRTKIKELNNSIERIVYELENKYTALKEKYAVEQELVSLRARSKIISQVEDSIEPELISIDQELDEIINLKRAFTIEDLAIMAYRITVVKQRSNLLLIQMISQEVSLYELVIACHACMNAIEDYVKIDIFHAGEGNIDYIIASEMFLFFTNTIKSFLPMEIEIMANFLYEDDQLSLKLFIDPKSHSAFASQFCTIVENKIYSNLDISCNFDEDGYRIIAVSKRGDLNA